MVGGTALSHSTPEYRVPMDGLVATPPRPEAPRVARAGAAHVVEVPGAGGAPATCGKRLLLRLVGAISGDFHLIFSLALGNWREVDVHGVPVAVHPQVI